MISYFHDKMKVNKDVATREFDFSVLISNVLMSMYGKCGILVNAHNVFETLPKQNHVHGLQ